MLKQFYDERNNLIMFNSFEDKFSKPFYVYEFQEEKLKQPKLFILKSKYNSRILNKLGYKIFMGFIDGKKKFKILKSPTKDFYIQRDEIPWGTELYFDLVNLRFKLIGKNTSYEWIYCPFLGVYYTSKLREMLENGKNKLYTKGKKKIKRNLS